MTEPQSDSPATDRDAAVSLDAVSFSYPGGPRVLHEVSAALPAGRVCAIIGPNAAGKSTLLRVMLGQLEPDQGRALLCGNIASEIAPAERARWVSYVPQRGAVGFAFTVRQIVAMGAFASRDGDAVGQAIAQCDLADLEQRVFAELSGGQQQRVLLARAIAQSAPAGRAMLLDEPVSHLDLSHIHGMMAMMRTQAERGLAVGVVLHDLNLAARYADDVWLMDAGCIAAAGSWDAVMRPDLLEPVYRVGLRVIGEDAGGRPVFVTEPGDTIDGRQPR